MEIWAEVARLTGAPADYAGAAVLVDLARGFLDPRLTGEDARRGLILLAAHLWYTISPRIDSESVGGVSVSYARAAVEEGLRSTPWGQMYWDLVRRRGGDLPVTVL